MTNWILTSCILIVAVIALRAIFKGRISMRMRYGLWALVLIRLLIPGNFIPSHLSVENLALSFSQQPQIQEFTQEWNAPQQSYESIYQEVVQEHYQAYYPEMSTTPATPPEALTATLPEQEQVMIQQEAQKRVEQSTPIYNLTQIFTGIWILGALIAGTVLLTINWDFSRRLKLTRRAVEANAPIPVYKSFMAETPCLFGLIHPVIYITEETAADPVALSHILAHESTHYRHKDHVWAFLRSICLVLHWYNPLVWLAVSLSKRDCELACDEATIAHIGEEHRIPYGKTLISITCIKRAPSAVLLTATTMLSDKKTLTERIQQVARKPKVVISAVVAAVIIAAVAVGCTFTGAPNETTDPTDPVETTEATEPTETIESTELTEPVEYAPITPTHGVQEYLDYFLISYNGYLYTAVSESEALPDNYKMVGSVLKNDNTTVPVEDFSGCHMQIGTEIYASQSDDTFVYVGKPGASAYMQMLRTDLIEGFSLDTPHTDDLFQIPEAPAPADVLPMPLYYGANTLVTPYWEQGVDIVGHGTYFISIPSVFPFSQDAVDCQADIYNDLLPTLKFYEETAGYTDIYDVRLLPMSEKENVRYLAGIDYAAYEYKDILSIVVWVKNYYDGIDYYVYNLDLDTGKRMDNADVLKRLGIGSSNMKALFDAAYVERFGDYQTPQREKTVSTENIAASQIYVTNDGTVMVAATIYQIAGADSNMHLLTLYAPPVLSGRSAIKYKHADWNYEPSSTAEDTARSIVSHFDGAGTIHEAYYDEEMTNANITSDVINSEVGKQYGLTEDYLRKHFKCIVTKYDYTAPNHRTYTYIAKLWLMQDEEDGLWYLWGSLTPYEYEPPLPDPIQFPGAPAKGSVQALPENAQLSDLISPYWQKGIHFVAVDKYYVIIPEIYPFSQEAIDCEQEIYKLFADALKERFQSLDRDFRERLQYFDVSDADPSVGQTSAPVFYYGYTASYQDGVLSIVVIIDERIGGQETYHTFNLNVPSGQIATGAQPSREAIRAALEAEYKQMHASIDSSLDFYQENLKKTLSDENIDACVLSYAEDGAPQITAWIYTFGSVEKVQKLIPVLPLSE